MAGEGPKTPAKAREVINKVRVAISQAIDSVKDTSGKSQAVGVARLAEGIRDALQRDPIRTLKDLAPYMPKDVSIETFSGKAAESLTNEELADIIARRAADRIREDEEREQMLH